MKSKELMYQQQQLNKKPAGAILANLSFASRMNKDITETPKMAGTQQQLSPSPYLQNFVKSSYKQTNGAGGSLNDSLDKLKLEFMHGYNDVMQESDTAQRLETYK